MTNIIGGLGIVAALILGVLNFSYLYDLPLGATIPTTKLPCITQGDEGKEVTQCATREVLLASANDAEGFFRNSTGETIVVDRIEFETTGAAVNTLYAEAATSSASDSPDNQFYGYSVTGLVEIATATAPFVFKSDWNVATSTYTNLRAGATPEGIATSTTWKAKHIYWSKGQDTRGSLGSFRVANGDYVIYHLVGEGAGKVSFSPTATSSARGLDLKVRIYYHY